MTTITGKLGLNPMTLMVTVKTEKGYIQPMQLKTNDESLKGFESGDEVILTTTAQIYHLRSNGQDMLSSDHKWLRTAVNYDVLPNTWGGYGKEPLGHYLQIEGEVNITRPN